MNIEDLSTGDLEAIVNNDFDAVSTKGLEIYAQFMRGNKPQGAQYLTFDGDVPRLTHDKPAAAPSPSFIDKALGAGEVAATIGTGATTGALGMITGAARGLVNNPHSFGSGEFADYVEQQAARGGELATYSPTTAQGQQYMRGMAPALGALPPIIGATNPGQGAAMSSTVPPMLRQFAPVKPQLPGSFAFNSAGAAAVPDAVIRRSIAASMPVPFTGDSGLTRGQATRNFTQLQFERESAKLGDLGAPLRDRAANQRQVLDSNFDEITERINPAAIEPREIGAAADAAVRARRAREKQRVTDAYALARASGEMESPVNLSTMDDVFAKLEPMEGVAGNIPAMKKEAARLGLADLDENGAMIFRDNAPLDAIETFRQFVNETSDLAVPREARARRIVFNELDSLTQTAGGELYKRARRIASSVFDEFDNTKLTRQLLGTKRGTNERAMALENVAQDVIVNASVDEINKFRGTLLRSGSEGKQVWQDLKAYGIAKIRERAFGRQTDERGNPIPAPASFLKEVERFDKAGKLTALYGKKVAQTMRDLAELARDIETAPPGAINHSNTSASLQMAIMEMGINTWATGLPVPIVASVKEAAKFAKNQALKARINAALKGN